MSNYILSNNQTFSDIFTPRGRITSNSIGSTGIKMSVIAGDSNPLTVQQTINDNITFQTTLTNSINLIQNNVSSMKTDSTGVFLNPNNANNIVMNNSTTTSFKQFNYGAIDISPTTSFQLLAYHPRNIFVISSTNFTLTFPANPPPGTFFRIIKAPVTFSTTFTITLAGGTFNLYNNGSGTITSNVSSLSISLTVFEFIYIPVMNIWQISSY